jgi:dehydrogenase/reductase SDR family protein 7B
MKNKVVWITGASSGIGEALAYAFSTAGARLLLSARRTEELERVKRQCAFPELTRVLPMDLLDVVSFGERVREAVGAFGQVDILVHNGGVTQRGLVEETELSVQRQVMELDYFSYVALTKAMLPHFMERKSGHFVVMSSVMGKIGTPLRSAYAAAKHALHGFFDCLRAEVSAMNIKVTVLTPGYIQTNIAQNALLKDGSKMGRTSEHIDKGLPAGRAAEKILRAVRRERYEAYIGKRSMEWVALVLNRWAPGLVMKLAPRFVPK